ncbi:unnamed protein product, partial [Ectocarpus sp. 12 AP-2014]
ASSDQHTLNDKRRKGKPACLLCLALSYGTCLRFSPVCVWSCARVSLGRNLQSNKRRYKGAEGWQHADQLVKAKKRKAGGGLRRDTRDRQQAAEAPREMSRRNTTGAQPLGRQKRKIGSDADCGGLVGGVFRRQATGGRGRRRSTGQSFVLSATGNFHRRLRKDLEGVPELIADVRKSLISGDNAALFTAVIEVRSKLIEGNSTPFDLPIRSTNSSSRGGGG